MSTVTAMYESRFEVRDDEERTLDEAFSFEVKWDKLHIVWIEGDEPQVIEPSFGSDDQEFFKRPVGITDADLTTTADTPTLADMEEKYRDLVWYARKDETLRAANLQVAEQCAQVEHKYPAETAALASEHGDWQHGFHSGVLAALRLVRGGRITQESMEQFPMLDS